MYPQSTRVISGLWRRRGRVIAQIVLVLVSIGTGAGAGYRLLEKGGAQTLFGEHIQATPAAGPVGMTPFFELRGFQRGRKVTVFMCSDSSGPIEYCVELASGNAPGPLRSKPIPEAFPDAEDIVPAPYVLRAGPTPEGEYPVRGNFEIERFKVGTKQRPRSFAGVVPQALSIGRPEQIARGAACRAPLFLPDGRLAVGNTVVDPLTGVTIHLDVQGLELAWSPLGDKLAILTLDRKEIRLAAPDGEDAVTAVREARGLLSSLSWSPQGDRLAFIAQNDPNTRGGPGLPTVRILNSVNGQVTSAGPGIGVAWSSRPDLLAVERADGALEASTTSGQRRRLQHGHEASWSADGSLIAFVSSVQGESGEEGWIARADGSQASPVVGEGVCALSFAPSGRSLAVVTGHDTETSLSIRSIDIQR